MRCLPAGVMVLLLRHVVPLHQLSALCLPAVHPPRNRLHKIARDTSFDGVQRGYAAHAAEPPTRTPAGAAEHSILSQPAKPAMGAHGLVLTCWPLARNTVLV